MNLLAICLAMIPGAEDSEKFEQLYWQYRNLLF